MEDADLDEIRAKRLAQLQSEYKGGSDTEKAEQRKREQDEMKNTILTQVLTQSARARLNTLMIGKPEKGRLVENMLLQMARTGQIMSKLGESELINILEKVSEQMQHNTTVKFDRRRAALDDSDDDF
ncbi:programmed cell death protein 5 [Zootermopsis nevadensis]|uniref:Programmed cell death protein 5 n=1 Tax=Zootermopsis nevadensis TaxID=136037 RepID=A0A067R3U0_ZOONE|nr:programmed cell death protein 5 [Zootermopsis nevadensis]KDR16742.1 Programmed cell death protein 5 [Zootermopsis nevadensis]